MDFKSTISCHVAWKIKLSRYLAKPDGSLKSAEVSSDRNCELGQWIYGEGLKFASMPEFARLKNEHVHFHQSAASVISRADRGESVSEAVALGSKSEYSFKTRAT